MSEIDDLEAYETLPANVFDRKQEICRRNFMKGRAKVLRSSANSNRRRAWMNDAKRQAPSLPKLKFLNS